MEVERHKLQNSEGMKYLRSLSETISAASDIDDDPLSNASMSKAAASFSKLPMNWMGEECAQAFLDDVAAKEKVKMEMAKEVVLTAAEADEALANFKRAHQLKS